MLASDAPIPGASSEVEPLATFVSQFPSLISVYCQRVLSAGLCLAVHKIADSNLSSQDWEQEPRSMKNQWDTTQEDFERLLSWLHIDREEAGKKYEIIRYRLIKFFTCRSCADAEDLSDETISRVTARVAEIAANYEGDPALYFYGVAKKVHLEYLRKQNRPTPPLKPDETSDEEDPMYECLDGCMEKLPEKTREIVLRYYQSEKKVKIDNRRTLADELGIGVNALRIRAHRIRHQLRKCVQDCLEQLTVN